MPSRFDRVAGNTQEFGESLIIVSGSKYDNEQLRRIDREHLKYLGKPYSIEQLLVAVGAAMQP